MSLAFNLANAIKIIKENDQMHGVATHPICTMHVCVNINNNNNNNDDDYE